jgi:uncharacterized protein YgbK (DUF1537 family)
VLKFAIIADDLTGANDSGVQLARKGIQTSLILRSDYNKLDGRDVVVFDTDSRSSTANEAYKRVKQAAEIVKRRGVEHIYKKMDSTLRGNIGTEIDAIYDVFQPDFVVIAPGYPQNGRQVIQGYQYVHQRLLHETEVSRDPKTPVTESYIPDLLRKQTKRSIGLVTCEEMASGLDLKQRLANYRAMNIPYILFDSKEDRDLQWIVEQVVNSGYSVVWAGSAGLARYLPADCEMSAVEEADWSSLNGDQPLLLVIGSISSLSRRQLNLVLSQSDTCPIALQSQRILGEQRKEEVDRVVAAAGEALQVKRNIALYSTGEPADVREAIRVGTMNGYSARKVSDEISEALGEAACQMIERYGIKGIVLTGGDTAKQVCTRLGYEELIMIGEVESGVPVGRLAGNDGTGILAVTKAGNFGNDSTLLHAVKLLRGEVAV